MTEPNKSPDLSKYDAMMITLAVTEAFMSIDHESLSIEMKIGAVMLYDQVMRRVKSQLPEGMDTVEAIVKNVESVAASVRRIASLPPVAS